MSAAVIVAVARLVVAPLLAVLVGKGIRLADDRRPHGDLDDHFDGIPVDCLSPAEVDRRFAGIERTWWA